MLPILRENQNMLDWICRIVNGKPDLSVAWLKLYFYADAKSNAKYAVTDSKIDSVAKVSDLLNSN